MRLAGVVQRLAAAAMLWCVLGIGLGSAQEAEPTSLVPDVLSLPALTNAHYFVQADGKGDLFLLRGDTLEVYPIQGRKAGKATRFQLAAPTSHQFSEASMAENARSWALVEANRILYVKDGMLQKTPEVGWLVTSVALVRDNPVAAVLPMSVGGARSRPKSPPLIVRLGNSGWETLVNGAFPRRLAGKDSFNMLFAENTVKLAAGTRGRLWVAYPYTGKIVRYTPSGRADLVIVVGKGEPTYRGDEKQLRQELVSRLEERGYKNSRAQIGVFTAQVAIRGMTEGRDGALYLLLASSLNGESSLLARYDIIEHTLKVVPVHTSGEGLVNMAASRDVLAWAAAGSDDLLQLSWSVLEAADWRLFEDVRLVSGDPTADSLPGSR